jgi:hypothetical protein
MCSVTVGKDSRAATHLAREVRPGSALDLPHTGVPQLAGRCCAMKLLDVPARDVPLRRDVAAGPRGRGGAGS